jgi:hypothetical protein
MKHKWIYLIFFALFVGTNVMRGGFLISALRKLQIERKLAEGESRGMSKDSIMLLKKQLAEIEAGEDHAIKESKPRFGGADDNNGVSTCSTNNSAPLKITPYWASQIDDENGNIVLMTSNVVTGIDRNQTYYIHLLLGANDLSDYQYIGRLDFEYDVNINAIKKLSYTIPSYTPQRHYDYFVICVSQSSNYTSESILDKVIVKRDVWIQHYSYQYAQTLAGNAIDNPMSMTTNLVEMNNLIYRHYSNITCINNYPTSGIPIMVMPTMPYNVQCKGRSRSEIKYDIERQENLLDDFRKTAQLFEADGSYSNEASEKNLIREAEERLSRLEAEYAAATD